MDSILVDKLMAGTILVTPTRRLASHCQDKIAKILSLTKVVWKSAAVYSIEDWYQSQWALAELQNEGQNYLLTPTQSLLAFEHIIVSSTLGALILDPYQTAKIAYEAWKILHQWQALELLAQDYTQIDTQTFTQWAKSYQDFLVNNNMIDGAMLPQKILSKLVQGPPQSVIFYGFEEQTPFLEYFAQALTQAGWQIEWESPQPIIPKSCVRQAYLDEDQEQEAAVRFAKTMQQTGKKAIAIVVPHLADVRQKMQQRLQDAFDPLNVGSAMVEVDPHFNISAAVPLVDYPLVSIALACLRLGLEGMSVKDYQRIVASPWLHASTQTGHRYVHLNDIKRWHRGTLTLKDILYYLNKSHSEEMPWAKQLTQLTQKISKLPSQAPYYYWVTVFRECLSIIGWPANPALTSTEYQSVMRFESLLQELNDCDAVLGETSYRHALHMLQKLASYIPFQPENKGASVQVLGVLEAAGQQFDALWVMGMQSEAWPPPAKHNPFIDLDEQRKRQMPHASAEREMLYAANMTARFKQSASQVIFSYALQNKERKLEVSELCRDLPQVFDNYVASEIATLPSALETFTDSQAPALKKGEMFKASSRLLELQSACPFRAFAEYRLGATLVDEKSIWLEPRDQGTILHTILEKWWKLDSPSEAMLVKIIESTLSKHLSPKTPPAYFEVEVSRLQMILSDYFALESARPPFTVVATECQQSYTIGQVRFSIRCDRIDEDMQGRRIIVDYKTGKFSLYDWESDRLASPQMPLYALAFDGPSLSALMIISIRTAECQYIGLSSEDLGIRGLKVKDNFEAIKQHWQIQLAALSDAFAKGDAKVDPRAKESTCQFCHLGPLCRIREQEAQYDL